MEVASQNRPSNTNCLDCERYKQLGEVCVIEHGKKFLWEYCKDFVQEVKLPDYNELMKTVRQDMALERKKVREKKKREVVAKRKERDRIRKEKLSLKRSKIAKRVWENRRKKLDLEGSEVKHRDSGGDAAGEKMTTKHKGSKKGGKVAPR